MTLKERFEAGISALEKLFVHVPPELRDDAVKTAADLRDAAVTATDAEVTQLAPSLAPEVIALINEGLAKVEAEATAKLSAIQSARAALPTS